MTSAELTYDSAGLIPAVVQESLAFLQGLS